MPEESIDIRNLLIERVRELKRDLAKATSAQAIAFIEDMLAVNKRIYFFIFKGEV